MKIIFAGTPQFALPSLLTLIKHHAILAVVTNPDKPIGRGRIVKPTPIKKLALKHNLLISEQPINSLKERLTLLKPDLLVVVAYGQIISQEILDIPKCGAINLHPSLLPKYRGPSPIQAAILNGDKETGVTIIKMNAELDAGPIIGQAKIKITADETAGTLHDKLALLGAELLGKILQTPPLVPPPRRDIGRCLRLYRSNPQNHSQTTYTKKITSTEAELNLTKPADFLERQVRAYNPWPGAYIKVQSAKCKVQSYSSKLKVKRLKIFQTEIKQNSQLATRQLVNSSIDKLKIYQNQPTLICGDGNLLILTEVQPEGRKKMSGEEFVRGYLK